MHGASDVWALLRLFDGIDEPGEWLMWGGELASGPAEWRAWDVRTPPSQSCQRHELRVARLRYRDIAMRGKNGGTMT